MDEHDPREDTEESPDKSNGHVATDLDVFLLTTPPGNTRNVPNIRSYISGERELPILKLYCSECNHDMKFSGETQSYSLWGQLTYPVVYMCRCCLSFRKSYLLIVFDEQRNLVIKAGEFPIFWHEPLPSGLLGIFDSDEAELFKQGHTAERHGMGIGSFAYYRHIVETHKNKIIEQLIKVVKRTPRQDSEVLLRQLEAAKKEKQFDKSIEMIKDRLPDSILIDGKNPLRLLHRALSKGLHGGTDKNCLKYAHHIRLVLSDLARKVKSALVENAELSEAVKELMNPSELSDEGCL